MLIGMSSTIMVLARLTEVRKVNSRGAMIVLAFDVQEDLNRAIDTIRKISLEIKILARCHRSADKLGLLERGDNNLKVVCQTLAAARSAEDMALDLLNLTRLGDRQVFALNRDLLNELQRGA